MKHFRIPSIILLLIFFSLNTVQAVNYGEAYEVGTTWMYNQHTSTIGKMIARDRLGGTHFVWTKAVDENHVTRHVFYNFYSDEEGDIADQFENNATRADEVDRSGYGSIDLYIDGDFIVPVCFYYASRRAVMSIDFEWGYRSFSEIGFNVQGMVLPLGVKGTIDRNLNAHVTASTSEMGGDGPVAFDVVLWHAEPGEDLNDWDVGHINDIETCTGITQRIQASRTSDEVALAWHHNLVGVPAPEGWANTTAHTMNNDLYLYESPDGEEWDIEEAINITSTIEADKDRNGVYAYGDTLRPYNDVDIIYVGDIVHVVFTTRGYWADPTEQFNPPVESWTTEESFIWHWDSESDTLTLVADGWYENGSAHSALNSNVDRPSLGVDEDGNLYCVFRQITDDDVNVNASCLGEVMLAISIDGGETWSEAINLTGTENEDNDEEEYCDENFPSIAEMVDDCLHIFYQLAPDASGLGEETTENRMIYQNVPIDDLPDVDDLELPREGFKYHNSSQQAVGQDLADGIPAEFGINSVYPNPFNAETIISYTLLKPGQVKMSIYSITGQEINVVKDDFQQAGVYKVNINASGLSTGVYIIRLDSNDKISTTKLVLVR
ncbi:MAG: T9SS type A sorting domain-containing protein [Candidatus Hatepunaea meridiana]|nr:T9SS type A sorting domain-containing protein [Candidatus Hatepunaea meridiana]